VSQIPPPAVPDSCLACHSRDGPLTQMRPPMPFRLYQRRSVRANYRQRGRMVLSPIKVKSIGIKARSGQSGPRRRPRRSIC